MNNEYEDVDLKDCPPLEPQFHKLIRTILSDEPRVTKFKIDWSHCSSNADIKNADIQRNDKNTIGLTRKE